MLSIILHTKKNGWERFKSKRGDKMLIYISTLEKANIIEDVCQTNNILV